MKCPVCVSADLQMTERQGVEIDYCPKCRGIWLDRGELDKIIDRAATYPAQPGAPGPAVAPPPPMPPPPMAQSQNPAAQYPPQYPPQPFRRDDDSDYPKYASGHHPHKKKRGFLGEIFDFD